MNNIERSIIFTFIFLFVIYIFLPFNFFSFWGVFIFLFFSFKLFFEIGYKIEIRDIIIFIAALQWIIGPLLTYQFFPNDRIYYMAVSEIEYMKFVVPATYAFAFGLYFPLTRKKISNDYYLEKIKEFIQENKNWDLILLIVGIIAGIAVDYVPVAFKFVLFLFSGLRFIGLYFLFLSNRKHKAWFVFSMIGWLFLSALKDTTFHEFILWLGFFIIIVAYITKPSIRKKIIYVVVLLLLIVVIQTVKFSYRNAVNKGNVNKLETFTSLAQKDVFNGNYVTSNTNLKSAVLRINQGWIIARIMYWTPDYEPFAHGETIQKAINASLLPRFLNPNKEIAGGRTYFKRFTGKNISNNTSMGLGLLGEAYANYGKQGGALFMFFIALFYNIILVYIYKLAIKHPTLIFFLPLIFLQVVKAEIDFSVILNHLLKASFAVWIFYFSLRKFFNFKI